MTASGWVILGLVIIVLLGLAVLSLIYFTHGSKQRVLNRTWYREQWLNIQNGLDKSNVDTYQYAILNADKLLDKALIELGVSGDTMGQRLKNYQAVMPNISKVWSAHKIRNRIAHEVNEKISPMVARRMLSVYKKALHDIGAI